MIGYTEECKRRDRFTIASMEMLGIMIANGKFVLNGKVSNEGLAHISINLADKIIETLGKKYDHES